MIEVLVAILGCALCSVFCIFLCLLNRVIFLLVEVVLLSALMPVLVVVGPLAHGMVLLFLVIGVGLPLVVQLLVIGFIQVQVRRGPGLIAHVVP